MVIPIYFNQTSQYIFIYLLPINTVNMKEFTIILSSFILFSCNFKTNEKNNILVEKTTIIKKNETKSKKEIDTVERLLPIPEFDNFKQFCETFGGSYLPKTYLYKPEKKAYFGAYHLYDRKKHVQMGFLIVHNTVDFR